MRRILTVVLAAMVVAAGCAGSTSDSVLIATEGSILELLPGSQAAEFNDDERYLVNLLISPISLRPDYRVHVVQAEDPNGGAEIGDGWYAPELVVESCSLSTDQAPMPIVTAGYIPGDPNESTTSDPFAVIDAPYQVAAAIQLFDSSRQRDAMASVTRQFYIESSAIDCDDDEGDGNVFGELVGAEIVQFTPVDVGHQGYGFEVTNQAGSTVFVLQHLVGERALLTSTLASPGFSEAPALTLDPATLEAFAAAQVAHLEANGLG